MITVIAGGVGAARFLTGLVQVRPPDEITAVVNVGDDTELHGLSISPDLDTITYTLAGAIDPERGWGLAGETWQAMETLGRLGGTHVVQPRRPRPRHPPLPHRPPPRGRTALAGHRRDRRRLGARARAAAGHRRPAADHAHHRRRGRPPDRDRLPGVLRAAAALGAGPGHPLRRRRRGQARRPACSRRSTRRSASSSHRRTRSSRSTRCSRSAACATRSPRRGSGRWPSPPSSPAPR